MLDFSDQQEHVEPVKYKGKEYQLREALEGDICKWRNSQTSKARFDKDGKFQGVGEIADSKPFLVHLCLWDGDRRVPLPEIRNWATRVVDAVFERIKEVNKLDAKETPPEDLDAEIEKLTKLRDAAKNSSSGTETT